MEAALKTHPMNPLDASWLQVESRDTPMHIAGLMPFRLPPGASPGYLRDLIKDLRASREFAPPWNLRLRKPTLAHPLPAWVEEADEDVDLEYHLRHSALPSPGGERELGQLIARLHSQQLDLSRPPWELHLIEGLYGDRFALYIKMHHSLLDGISGVRLLMRAMADDPAASLALPPFWSPSPRQPAKKKGRAAGKARVAAKAAAAAARSESQQPHAPSLSLDGILKSLLQSVGGQARTVPQLVSALGTLWGVRASQESLMLPFDAPRSSLNGRVRGQRRVATQQFPLERLKTLARAADCTLNDVVLAICGGALRRFLLDDGLLPDKPLTAGVPVSVRPADDEGTGNAITFIIATMATDVSDPLERLRAIVASTQSAKAHVQSLPRDAMTQYTMVLMAPSLISMLTPLGGRTRPMFNVTVSNVPGPDRPLYFRGALLEAIYPISLIAHGLALNITCESYAGSLDFAFTGCRDTLPHLQKLAPYSAEALEDLERAVAAAAAAAAAPARKSRPRAVKKASSPATTRRPPSRRSRGS